MKTSKQNRTRQTRHRASDRGEFCRTSAKIELTPNAASTFHSSCPHAALHSLSLEPNIALCVAIEPHVRQRTCCLRAQTNSTRFVRLVCFGFQFVSNSVRCANLFAESDCGVECEQVSFAHWVLYRLITQLCSARAEWWRKGRRWGERSAISWLYFRNLLFYLAEFTHREFNSSWVLHYFTMLAPSSSQRSVYYTWQQSWVAFTCVRRMLDERVKSGDFNERERIFMHGKCLLDVINKQMKCLQGN